MSRTRTRGGGRAGAGGDTSDGGTRARRAGSSRWITRQLSDPYVKRAKAEGFRARAAYKLIELDRRFSLLAGARRVVDLGAAPGSWTQAVRRLQPAARVVGVDLLPMEPIAGACLLQLDVRDPGAPSAIAEALGGPADLLLSDMAANTVGHPGTDHLRTMALVEAASDLAALLLRPGGAFVAKVLAGGAAPALVAELRRRFAVVRHAKPPASRRESSELYLVALGFRGVPGQPAAGPEA